MCEGNGRDNTNQVKKKKQCHKVCENLLLVLAGFAYWLVFRELFLFAVMLTTSNFLFHLLFKFTEVHKIEKAMINLCACTPQSYPCHNISGIVTGDWFCSFPRHLQSARDVTPMLLLKRLRDWNHLYLAFQIHLGIWGRKLYLNPLIHHDVI